MNNYEIINKDTHGSSIIKRFPAGNSSQLEAKNTGNDFFILQP